jgi:hypothetical protein
MARAVVIPAGRSLPDATTPVASHCTICGIRTWGTVAIGLSFATADFTACAVVSWPSATPC